MVGIGEKRRGRGVVRDLGGGEKGVRKGKRVRERGEDRDSKKGKVEEGRGR